ncbi:MAG: pyridoxal phosphate-dependent aminotransferase [Rubellimicrobium sp.]|nr:pyridoxal phosphate-dependent aminotransferase [Rubellimicrobium sp.]
MRYAPITERLANLGSDKWAVHFAGRARAAQGEEIIELSIGAPDVPIDPGLIAACTQALEAGRTGYADGRGEAGLRTAIARHYANRSGRAITADNVLCLPGTQTALFTTMTGLATAGDEVLVGDPLYAAYDGIIRSTGADKVSVPLKAAHGFRMQPEDLAAAITPRSRVLLLNSPHNPTGAVLSAGDIAALGEICIRHDLWIISDEVYEHFLFDGTFASPFDNPALAERTVVVSSISKSHSAPGFRSGWVVGPKEFCARLQPVSETMLFGSQPFIADMTAWALTHDSDTARRQREACARRVRIVCDVIGNEPAVRPLPPAAGMHILLDISATGLSAEAFAWGLLDDEKVCTMPGTSFGAAGEGFIRVSLTSPDDLIAEASRRIARFARSIASSGRGT